MAQFTPSKCYALSNYDVLFDKKGIIIQEINQGKVVDTRKFSDGFDIMVVGGDICFGSISFNQYFTHTLDLNPTDAGVSFDKSNKRVIGSTHDGDPGIKAHIYQNDTCPVRLKTDANDILEFKCPCDTTDTPCTNKCYSFEAPGS